MDRRTVFTLLGLAATAVAAVPVLRPRAVGTGALAASQGGDAPVGGNPAGDLTAVAFVDYECPECRAAAPQFHRFVADDRGVRLVYRDWPIVSPASRDAARLALAARYQDRYEAAHEALMAVRGPLGPVARLREVLEQAGLDIDRLSADARDREGDIGAQLARNTQIAGELRLRGVPAYVIGGPPVVRGFTAENFRDLAARARAEAARSRVRGAAEAAG